MAHIKRKYIDSHWLVFVFQGAIALLFGCLTLFAGSKAPSSLLPLVGTFLLALAIVEFANSIHRSLHQHGWLISTLVAVFDTAAGILMLFMTNEAMLWQLVVVAGYVLLRGVFELVIAARTTVDPTDRFIWSLCGICAVVFSIVIFNSGHLANVDFIRFLGAYMLIFGVSSLIYSVHNRTQQREDREARAEAAKAGAKTKKAMTKGERAA